MIKAKGTLVGAIKDLKNRRTIAQLELDGDHLEELLPIKDTEIDISIDKHREKRSLDANNYGWLLMDRMAKAMKSTKEEIYHLMLERYGTFIYLPANDEQIASLKAVYRIVRERGETTLVTPSGKAITCKQVQCYKGSSLMNTKEMSDFLDGVVSEAKELGIQTETPDEIARLKELWHTKA